MTVRFLSTSSGNLANDVDVVASWHVGAGAFMLAGYCARKLPRTGSARANEAAIEAGIFRSECWSRPDGPGFCFAVVIQIGIAKITGRPDSFHLRGPQSPHQTFDLKVTASTSAPAFGSLLAKLAGDTRVAVAEFLLDLRPSNKKPASDEFTSMLEHFLDDASSEDGCFELILKLPNNRVVIQGWGTDVGSERVTLLVGFAKQTADVGEFDRTDVSSPFQGSVVTFETTEIEPLTNQTSIFMLSQARILKRVMTNCRVLSGEEATGQFRHLSPRLRCSEKVQDQFRSMLRPTFGGQDTLGLARVPIRAALDLALSADTGGVYLAGWVVDPGDLIRECSFCYNNITTDITSFLGRVSRPDVAKAFLCETAGASNKTSNYGLIGFIDLIVDRNSAAHLQFVLHDGDILFFPVHLFEVKTQQQLKLIIGTVDIHSPSLNTILSHAVGPFIRKALSHFAGNSSDVPFESPLYSEKTLVVPLFRASMPWALISSFLEFQKVSSEKILFVHGSLWAKLDIIKFCETLSFYGIEAHTIQSAQSLSQSGLILDAIRMTNTERAIIISEECLVPTAKKRDKLYCDLETFDVVSATILSTDSSFRFAGSHSFSVSTDLPYFKSHSSYIGLLSDDIESSSVVEVFGGSFECFAIRTQILENLVYSPPYLSKPVGEAEFFQMIHRLGFRNGWDGAVQVTSSDDNGSDNSVEMLIDGWMFSSHYGVDKCAH